MEQENNKLEADTTAVDIAEAEPSEKKSSNLSKAKSDTVKSMAKNFLKTRKANVTSEVSRKKQRKKSTSISEGGKATENHVKKLNSVEENQQKKKSTSTSEGSKAAENDVKKLNSLEENQQKDAFSVVQSAMVQENNKLEADTTAVDLAVAEPSEKKNPNLLKAKSDTVKSMAKNFSKTRKANVTSEVSRKKQKKTSTCISEGRKATENDVKKLNSVEETQQKKKSTSISEGSKTAENEVKKLNSLEENQQKDATTSVEHVEKSRQIQKNEENNTSASDSKEKITKSQNDPGKQRNGEESGLSNNKKKIEEKEKNTNNSVKNNKNEEKHEGRGKKQEIEKKEKIDGLIFMCNAKTKPDCFRYRVLGVPAGKKDLVLGIRPGLKLFLYDYDLRLMYGIYKASSAGGMKLEPKAFGGAFPAQVRFSVHADCLPLAESIFKKAIKENYDERNKFKFELTARQVRKLTELFRPVPVHSTAPPFHSPSRASARTVEHPEKREARDRPREARPPSHIEAYVRDPYANINARGFSVLPHERDQRTAYGESVSTKREDGHRDLYLSEKEYRAYGLQGEIRNLTPQHHITPTLTSYLGDHREPYLQQPDTVRSNPLYLTEREYRTYDLGATREGQPIVSAATANTSLAGSSIAGSYIADPYYGHYSVDPLVDAYLPRPGAAHLSLIEPDHLRRENQADRLYSAYRSDALADPNQMHRYQDVKPASASTSVSSRYSFGGAYRL